MLLSTLALTSALMAPAGDGCSASTVSATVRGEKSIVETALGNENFSTLVTALKSADLVGALQGEGPFTVFAPTNDAFAKLPDGKVASLLEHENKGLLTSILTYHVVPSNLPASKVLKTNAVATLNGQRITFTANDNGVMVNGARVTTTDIHCTNGVIHVIDSVIIPSTSDIVATAVEAGSFKTLAAALKAAHLVEALQGDGPFTVFAPTDDAFAKLPKGTVESLLLPENREKLTAILKYHVVPGRMYSDKVLASKELSTLQGQHLRPRLEHKTAFIGNAKIVSTDIDTTNGVIHVIDSVLLPE